MYEIERLSDLNDLIKNQIDKAVWSLGFFYATVDSQDPSTGEYNITPRSKTLPSMKGVKWIGGMWTSVSSGAKVICGFDELDNAWIVGLAGSAKSSTDWAPLGSALIGVMNKMWTSYLTHGHIEAGQANALTSWPKEPATSTPNIAPAAADSSAQHPDVTASLSSLAAAQAAGIVSATTRVLK